MRFSAADEQNKGKRNTELDERSCSDAAKGEILCINYLLLGYYVSKRQHTVEFSTKKQEGIMSCRNILDIKANNWSELRAFIIARLFSSEK